MRPYSLSEEQRKDFASLYVLEYMINRPKAFDIFLNENDSDLEPVLMWLMVKECVAIENDDKYVPTSKGRRCLEKFMARFADFLTMFDVFCAVDLTAGEFAFTEYHNYDDPSAWRSHLQDERWEDLRIAVADYKGMNPIEVVFMSFIAENRFGRDGNAWQFDLLLGTVWDEILEICDTALHAADLGYDDEDGAVSGDAVIEDVIAQGVEVMLDLLAQEQEIEIPLEHSPHAPETGEIQYVEKVACSPHSAPHYESYRDPRHVSPVWRTAWFE